MSKLAVIAKIPVKPGMRDEAIAVMQAALDSAEQEDGTIYYVLHIDPNDENSLWMYEMYTNADALTAHAGTDAFKALGQALRPFTAARPELTMLTPIGGKGL